MHIGFRSLHPPALYKIPQGLTFFSGIQGEGQGCLTWVFWISRRPLSFHYNWEDNTRVRCPPSPLLSTSPHLLSLFPYPDPFLHLRSSPGISLVVQWLRIRLPLQGIQVLSLVRQDPACLRPTKPVCHSYWACALEPTSHNYWARVLQLLKPVHLEPMLCNKRSHCDEKPAHRKEE